MRKEALKYGSPLPYTSSNSITASQDEGGPTSLIPTSPSRALGSSSSRKGLVEMSREPPTLSHRNELSPDGVDSSHSTLNTLESLDNVPLAPKYLDKAYLITKYLSSGRRPSKLENLDAAT